MLGLLKPSNAHPCPEKASKLNTHLNSRALRTLSVLSCHAAFASPARAEES